MKKQENQKVIMQALRESNKDYQILDGCPMEPKHVRVKGVCDVWPSSGTFRVGDKYTKRNLKKFLELIGSNIKPESPTKKLQARVDELEAIVENMQEEIDSIKQMVGL